MSGPEPYDRYLLNARGDERVSGDPGEESADLGRGRFGGLERREVSRSGNDHQVGTRNAVRHGARTVRRGNPVLGTDQIGTGLPRGGNGS